MVDRDDRYWRQAGETDPYWAVLSQPRYSSESIDAEGLKDFYAEGVQDIAFVLSCIERQFDAPFAPKRALDFGCGVGRLVAPMTLAAEHVFGIDISPGMLKRADDYLKGLGIENFTLSDTIPEKPLDWINSYIVFQHIQPALGVSLLENLLDRLEVGGTVSLHFTIYRDRRVMHRGFDRFSFGRFDGQRFVGYDGCDNSDMPIYEYDLSEILMHLNQHGIEDVHIHHTDHGGSHGAWIFGQRRV